MLVTNVIFPISLGNIPGTTGVNIVFSREDALDINPHDNDPLVITVQHGKWDIKHLLIDLGSSVDTLFWDTFQRLQLDLEGIQRFNGSLTGLSGEHAQVMGYVALRITCDEGPSAKIIDVRYLILDVVSPYNIILASRAINAL